MNSVKSAQNKITKKVIYSPRKEAEIRERARIIKASGGLHKAIVAGKISKNLKLTVSEATVLALLKQGVTKYLGILGHGTTDVGEIIRIYTEEGVTHFFQCRNEVAMAHAATSLAWVFGETPAVITSIGPGALQAFAGSLAAASNGIGVYHIYGDETTHGEGYNMQQIPTRRQNQFLRITETMSGAYTLHTAEALREAMRLGTETVHNSYHPAPFYLMLPINIQPKEVLLNLEAFPDRMSLPAVAPVADDVYEKARQLIKKHQKIVIKAGGGTHTYPKQLLELAKRTHGTVVLSPVSIGVLPDSDPHNMHVGGSKGSISGNYAMENATLLIVVGARAVCQSDCSGTGYPNVTDVININGRYEDVNHYNHTVCLTGDIGAVIDRLVAGITDKVTDGKKAWLKECLAKKDEWNALKQSRSQIRLFDEVWGREVMTQPTAISVISTFANKMNAFKLFDAGDVQAVGFQVVEDDRPDQTYTEAGASYMGFAASGMLAAGLADDKRYVFGFTGDGSFMMNPQILIDAVVHGVRGTLVIFDNRRMGAISSLQASQYGPDFGTNDKVAVDYVTMANSVTGVQGIFGGWSINELKQALVKAVEWEGLSVIHVPVYWGEIEEGGMGAYGRWNVGPWVEKVEEIYQSQSL